MRQARFYFPAALLFAALLAIPVLHWGSAFAQDKGKDPPAAPLVKWEYKVIDGEGDRGSINNGKMEQTLNNLGKEGWECVGTVSEVRGGSTRASDSNWTRAILICKRPKQ